MYTREMLNGLTKKMNQTQDEGYKKFLLFVIERLKECVHYYFGPDEALLNTFRNVIEGADIFTERSGGDIRLPYPLCSFQYVSQNHREKYCNLVEETMPGCLTILHCYQSTGGWGAFPLVSFVSVSKDWKDNPIFVDEIQNWSKMTIEQRNNLHGNILNILLCCYDKYNQDSFLKTSNFLKSRLTYVNSSILLLNCRNIVQEDVLPKVDTTKKKKFDKNCQFVYKILKVKVPRTRKRRTAKDIINVDSIPLHLVQGHYKVYNENESRGLFGKLYGRWWWQPHLAGNIENGIVDKDYDVKNMKE